MDAPSFPATFTLVAPRQARRAPPILIQTPNITLWLFLVTVRRQVFVAEKNLTYSINPVYV